MPRPIPLLLTRPMDAGSIAEKSDDVRPPHFQPGAVEPPEADEPKRLLTCPNADIRAGGVTLLSPIVSMAGMGMAAELRIALAGERAANGEFAIAEEAWTGADMGTC